MTVRPLPATLTSRTNRRVTDNVPIFNLLGLTVKEGHELYPSHREERNGLPSVDRTIQANRETCRHNSGLPREGSFESG